MTIGPTRRIRARRALVGLASLVVLGACADDAPPVVSAPATAVPGSAAAAVTTTTVVSSADLFCGRTVVQRAGIVAADELTEISGVAASRKAPDVVWVHNDSGDGAVLYALDLTGATRARVEVLGASAVDWEDIAAGPGPDPAVPSLFVADIGDNETVRDHVVIYRFPEPDLPAVTAGVIVAQSVTADVITLRYPDRPHDAESFMVDPATGDWYVITKETRESSTVFRAARPGPGATGAVLAAVGTIGVRPDLVTSADISPDGSTVVVRTYLSVRSYRIAGGDVASAFRGVPCYGPFVGEAQGEAIAFRADGRAMITISEGEHPTINLVEAAP